MKRIAALLLTAAIVFGMTTMAFAANPKITKQSASLGDKYVSDATPGQKIFLPFVKEAFEDNDGNQATGNLTAADVRASKITVKHTVKSGPKAIDSVDIKENNGVAGVLVTLVDPFTSTKSLDFELSVTLYINGKRQSHSTIVEGTLANEEQIIDSYSDYIDLSDGSVAICEENVPQIEAFLGEDVSMFIRMVKGKSYAGVANTDPTDSDIGIFDQYPDIVNVYNLTVSGLSGSGNTVKLDTGSDLYVYDGDLNYLGTTDKMIPFREKYFTAEKKLDVIDAGLEEEDFEDGDADYEPELEEEPDDIAGSGLPSVTTSGKKNTGDNPDTGIPALFGVSIAAGILSLAAMGVTSKAGKKK